MSTRTGVSITADPDLPIIHITRDFQATPAQLQRAHVDAQMLVDSLPSRNGWLESGMEGGMNDGYAKLDTLLGAGDV